MKKQGAEFSRENEKEKGEPKNNRAHGTSLTEVFITKK